MRGWTGARRNRARTRAVPARVSVRIDGSHTVAGCIRRRWRREPGNLRTSRRVDRVKCRRAPRPEWRLRRHRIRAESQQGEFAQECLQSNLGIRHRPADPMADVLQFAEDPRVAHVGFSSACAPPTAGSPRPRQDDGGGIACTSISARSAVDATGESCRVWRSWRRHEGGDGPGGGHARPTDGVPPRSGGSGRARAHGGCGFLRSGRPRPPAAAGRASRPARPAVGGATTRRARRESL